MITRWDALTELGRLIDDGWYPLFQDAALRHNWALENLFGIASVETNCQHEIGDGGRGYGILQIDIGTDPTVPSYWQNKALYLEKAVSILDEKRQWILDHVGQQVTIGPDSQGNVVTIVVPDIPEPDLTRVAIASYNGGEWCVYQYAHGRDPDRSTTGKDYSFEVLGRAMLFKSWISEFSVIFVITPPGGASGNSK